MNSILVSGANRGLGLEFVRQCAAGGWRVVAGCRTPDDAPALQDVATKHPKTVSLHRLDVKDHGQIEALARQLQDEPLDVLLNNAGLYGPNKMYLGAIDYPAWEEVLAVNTIAPLKMAECFLDHVVRGQDRKSVV